MTPTDLETAGPALDAWVAEHVFGWEFRVPMEGHGFPKCWCPPGKKFGQTMPNRYSENIESAWRVVERMRETKHACTITVSATRDLVICTFDGGEAVGCATAPLAICLAAKKALESAASGAPERAREGTNVKR